MSSTISVAGRTRSFTVVGDAQGPAGRALVLVFHGSKQDGEIHQRFTGGAVDRLADEGRAVIAYLDGYRGNWNDARAQSSFPARTEQIDDVAFARAVVESIAASHGINRDRVVGVGYSNGGQMVFKFLHESMPLLSAGVVVAATMPDRDGFLGEFSDAPSASIPVTVVAGTSDRIVPFEGGRMAWWARALFKVGGTALSADATARYFARRNWITSAPVVTELPARQDGRKGTSMTKASYRDEGRAPVTLYTVIGGGHTVPGTKPAPAVLGRTGSALGIEEMVGEALTAISAIPDADEVPPRER